MEEIFENSLLDELYKVRKKEFEKSFLQKYGKEREEESVQVAEEIKGLIRSVVETEEVQNELLEQFEKLIQAKKEYWSRAYYKLGIVDGVKFVSETKKMYDL